MARTRKFLIVARLFMLSACSGAGYAIENYSGVDVQHIQVNGESWRIFDKPNEGRLMVTPSLGRAASVGAVQGATFGISDGGKDTMAEFEAAADACVKWRNSRCGVSKGA